MDLYAVIQQPLLTEKMTGLRESENKYAFKVAAGADKLSIKQAVEGIFKVKVLSVHTLVQRGKMKRVGRTSARTPTWKKAIVQVQAGQKLEFFEGV